MNSRWLDRAVPGLAVARSYRREWLLPDLAAGAALSAVLVPAGMAYATAAGLPPETGLYATVVPLLVYALLGPSRILVLGPDSSLAPMIAAAILPLAAAGSGRAVALAGLLSILVGAFLMLGRLAKLGFLTGLLSNPIRTGYLNGIALVVAVAQLPKLAGIDAGDGAIWERAAATWEAAWSGEINVSALALGAGSLAVMALVPLLRTKVPGVLVAVAAAVAATMVFGLQDGLPVAGGLSGSLPAPALGGLQSSDLLALAAPAAGIALIAFTDTSVLSHSLASRDGARIDGGQEMGALGGANVAAGLFGGFPISASTSRTPVAAQSGARTQLAMVVAALLVLGAMLAFPWVTGYLPESVLAAVVLRAAASMVDVRTFRRLLRMSRMESALLVVAFLGVAFVGVLEGIVIAVVLSLLAFVRNAWNPYRTELVDLDDVPGFHDIDRHPEGHRIPGLVLARFDAPLFFANGKVFSDHVRGLVDAAPQPVRWVVVAGEPITGIDTTATDDLVALDKDLEARGVDLYFAELKGPIKDRLVKFGVGGRFSKDHFHPTLHQAVREYQRSFPEAAGEG